MALATFIHTDRLLTIPVAAQKLEFSEKRLRQLVIDGAVKAALLPSGEVGISETEANMAVLNEKLAQVRREQFDDLNDGWLTISEAASECEVPRPTLRTWTIRGYIKVIKRPDLPLISWVLRTFRAQAQT